MATSTRKQVHGDTEHTTDRVRIAAQIAELVGGLPLVDDVSQEAREQHRRRAAGVPLELLRNLARVAEQHGGNVAGSAIDASVLLGDVERIVASQQLARVLRESLARVEDDAYAVHAAWADRAVATLVHLDAEMKVASGRKKLAGVRAELRAVRSSAVAKRHGKPRKAMTGKEVVAPKPGAAPHGPENDALRANLRPPSADLVDHPDSTIHVAPARSTRAWTRDSRVFVFCGHRATACDGCLETRWSPWPSAASAGLERLARNPGVLGGNPQPSGYPPA